MVVASHLGALFLYGLTGLVLLGSLAGSRPAAPRWAAAVAGAAVAVHGWALVAYARAFGELPLVGLAPSLSSLGFLIGVFLVVVVWFRDSRPLGLVLAPLVFGLLGAALLLGVRPAGEALAFRGFWFALHVVLAFAGYAGLAVAFAAGLAYLVQFRALRGKRFGRVFRFFPSLVLLDRVGRRALLAGFPALSVALLVGWTWTVRFQRSLAVSDPQVIWGVLSWLVFVVALAVRAGGGTAPDRRAALAAVLGFLAVVAAYVALRVSVSAGRLFL